VGMNAAQKHSLSCHSYCDSHPNFMDWYNSHGVSQTLSHNLAMYNANDKYIQLKLVNL